MEVSVTLLWPRPVKNDDFLLIYSCSVSLCHMTCFLFHPKRCEHCAHSCVCVFFFPPQRKKNNNIFVDDLKDEGEKRPVPKPCCTFLEAFDRYPEIMENIKRVAFDKPTPIQVWRRHLSTLTLPDRVPLELLI